MTDLQTLGSPLGCIESSIILRLGCLLVCQVVELGQLGLAEDGPGSSTFYLHSPAVARRSGTPAPWSEAFKAAGRRPGTIAR